MVSFEVQGARSEAHTFSGPAITHGVTFCCRQSPLPSAPEPAASGSQAASAGPAPKQQAPKEKRPPAPKPPARSGATATPTPGKTPKLRSSSLGGIGLVSPAKRSTLAPLPNSLS